MWKIPLFKIYWDEEDVKAVENIIRSGMDWSSGKEIEELETAIAEYIGTKYCVVFNSGGSALHALMLAYDFKPGDEIIVPSFTFIATAYAPMYVGAKPIFVDIEEETMGLNPEDVKEKITRKTKAMIPVHYGGLPCRIRELREIAGDHDLVMVEDAAEAFGAKIGGGNIGTFGDSSVFSFCQNKIFTTGEGGCVVTDNAYICDKVRLIRSYGRASSGSYFTSNLPVDYVIIGHNWRLPTMLAALALSQLKKVDKMIKMRRENVEYLNKEFREMEMIKVPEAPRDYFHVYQMYTIRVEEKRSSLMRFLAEKGIMTKIYFDPIHKYSTFKELCPSVHLPMTEKISLQVLTLPMYPHMTKDELNYLVHSIKEFFEL